MDAVRRIVFMKRSLLGSLILMFCVSVLICSDAHSQPVPRVVHVFVALADNKYQGIIPVPAQLGNGSDPARNLYWGAAYGVRTFFKASPDWELIWSGAGPESSILERCIFRHRISGVYLVADAYEGRQIRAAVTRFLSAAAGNGAEKLSVKTKTGEVELPVGGGADLIAYVGHDAFMDFQVPTVTGVKGKTPRNVIVLACASRIYFASYLKAAGAKPLLWTTNLMAPEAYTLKAAVDGWIAAESDQQIRERAATAYSKYQKCSHRAAMGLLVSGW
jgi:hypothetical protein